MIYFSLTICILTTIGTAAAVLIEPRQRFVGIRGVRDNLQQAWKVMSPMGKLLFIVVTGTQIISGGYAIVEQCQQDREAALSDSRNAQLHSQVNLIRAETLRAENRAKAYATELEAARRKIDVLEADSPLRDTTVTFVFEIPSDLAGRWFESILPQDTLSLLRDPKQIDPDRGGIILSDYELAFAIPPTAVEVDRYDGDLTESAHPTMRRIHGRSATSNTPDALALFASNVLHNTRIECRFTRLTRTEFGSNALTYVPETAVCTFRASSGDASVLQARASYPFSPRSTVPGTISRVAVRFGRFPNPVAGGSEHDWNFGRSVRLLVELELVPNDLSELRQCRFQQLKDYLVAGSDGKSATAVEPGHGIPESDFIFYDLSDNDPTGSKRQSAAFGGSPRVDLVQVLISVNRDDKQVFCGVPRRTTERWIETFGVMALLDRAMDRGTSAPASAQE